MKRISYAGVSLVTGSEVADRLLDFAMQVARVGASVTVEIPVLEENGTTIAHALLLTGSSQFDIADIDGLTGEAETARFPVPDFPAVGGRAVPVKRDRTGSVPDFPEEDLSGGYPGG